MESKPALLTDHYSQAYFISKQKLLQLVTFYFHSERHMKTVNLPHEVISVLKMSGATV